MKKLLHLVGYLHRCTKMMHGHTNIKIAGLQFIVLKHETTNNRTVLHPTWIVEEIQGYS